MGNDYSDLEKIRKHYKIGEDDHDHDHDHGDKSHQRPLPMASNPKRLAFHTKATKACEKLKEECCHHILLDIYLHALPMDDGCAEDKIGQCSDDLDQMLAAKGSSAAQYFRSAASATNAPLLEYVNRSIDMIGQQFMEAAAKKADEDLKEGIEPSEADLTPDEEEIDSQLVDVKKDTEYEDFIGKLKQKTIKKIVADISDMIADKKDETDMTFAPATESAFSQSMDYISTTMLKAGCEPDMSNDSLMEIAVRESTLFALDEVFNLSGDPASLGKKLRLGKGIVATESVIMDVCAQYGIVESVGDDYGAYNAIIADNVRFFEETANSFQTESVLSSVGKGITWVWRKIVEMCRRLKNFIKNALTPKISSQLSSVAVVSSVKQEAFKAAGISIAKPTAAKTDRPKDEVAESTAISRSLSATKADMLAGKANVDIILGNGNALRDGDGATITFNKLVSVLNGDEYLKWIAESFMPAVRSGFTNKADVQRAKERFTDVGSRIPISTGYIFGIHVMIKDHNNLIDKIESLMNSSDIKNMAASSDIDPFFNTMMNALYNAINTANNDLQLIANAVAVADKDPFTDSELKQIASPRDLGKIIESIICRSSFKNTSKAFLMTKSLITRTAKLKGWIISDDQAKSGASRITLIIKGDSNVVKYPWNRKGMIDNLKELKIATAVRGSACAKLMALPTEESSSAGAYLVIPKASPVTSDSGLQELVTKFDATAKAAGVKIKACDADRKDNFGTINGKLVFIDYGNFVVY